MSSELDTHVEDVKLTNGTFDDKSAGLFQSLLFKLKWKLRWIRIIDLPLLAAAFFVRGDLQILLVTLFLIYEITRAVLMHHYVKIDTNVDYTSTTQKVLTEHITAIKKILKFELIWSFSFLPLAAPAGFLVYKLAIFHTFLQVSERPGFWYQILLCALIGIPAIALTIKINNRAFGAYVRKMELKVEEMST